MRRSKIKLFFDVIRFFFDLFLPLSFGVYDPLLMTAVPLKNIEFDEPNRCLSPDFQIDLLEWETNNNKKTLITVYILVVVVVVFRRPLIRVPTS